MGKKKLATQISWYRPCHLNIKMATTATQSFYCVKKIIQRIPDFKSMQFIDIICRRARTFSENVPFDLVLATVIFKTNSWCLSISLFVIHLEMARDSAVGRERVLVVPGSLALDTSTNQHVAGAQNDLNQQILEVSFHTRRLINLNNLFPIIRRFICLNYWVMI